MTGHTTVVLWLLAAVHSQISLCYEIPDVKIEVLKPKGFRVSLPDSENLSSFAFHANINKPIGQNDVGTIGGEVVDMKKDYFKWVIEDPQVELKNGDVIEYYVFVSIDGVGYVKDGLRYVVGGGTVPTTKPRTTEKSVTVAVTAPPVIEATSKTCQTSVTTVKGQAVCKGAVVFEENFDLPINSSVWVVEHMIPEDHLEYPFNSYQRSSVSTEAGNLHINAKPQQDMPGFMAESNHLDLRDGCTGSKCEDETVGPQILPPVASGRVRSRFSFKYGRVDVRAKLPQGDWLYPEILLQPLYNTYGTTGYASGLIKIAEARGNHQLVDAFTHEYGNNVLEGGILVSEKCAKRLQYRRKSRFGTSWGDDFHTYSVLWTPDSITFMVDNERLSEFSPPSDGLGALLATTEPPCKDLPKGYRTKISPFDDEFFIVLGVAAGGTTEFPDTPSKPWRNVELKARLKFLQAISNWLPTWTIASGLFVDYVRVTAL